MNRIFTTLFCFVLTLGSVYAQVNGSGYYRVVSQGLNQKYHKDYYCCVTHNQVHINTSALTNQRIHAIQLIAGDYVANCDPSAVLYLSEPESKTSFNIFAQGCNLRNMINPQSMVLGKQANGDYYIQATKENATVYLRNESSLVDNHHYTCATGGNGSEKWQIYPVNSDNEYNWFGIQPTLTVGNKYYASFYAGFPFKCKSSGMKVYYVLAADDEHYELKEITGIVPASTPVLIECSSAEPKQNLIDILAPGSGNKIEGNKLQGVYFCNQYMSPITFQGQVTEFDPSTMRVWNVKDGQLVLSTAEEGLFKGTYKGSVSQHNYIGKLLIKANSAYLPVSASANTVLTLGTTALGEVSEAAPKIVSITNVAGQKVTSLVPGVNLIKYSDGTVKKVIR